jgi:2-polyprenyl-3-methyl-5-hydroxy-6-metoxy-1,4-benzoquinol methylase
MSRFRASSVDKERDSWNKKYREAAVGTKARNPSDLFLVRTFSDSVRAAFRQRGSLLNIAGGAGRHAIWLAKQGWQVTVIDISETGVEQARQTSLCSRPTIYFAVDDLTDFKAAQTQFNPASDVVMMFIGMNLLQPADRGI